jgi:hypothetical protein
MTTSITIHEFSTGITPTKSADGGWVSKGFTGRYMLLVIGLRRSGEWSESGR